MKPANSTDSPPTAGETRATYRIPRKLIGIFIATQAAPWVLLALHVAWRYSSLQILSALWPLAIPVASACLGGLVLDLIRLPVVADPEGIRMAWLFRLKWSEITGVRIRTYFGFRVLEITRRRGLPWRPLLRVYSDLPEFLSRCAPPGNPLRRDEG